MLTHEAGEEREYNFFILTFRRSLDGWYIWIENVILRTFKMRVVKI